MKKTTKKKETTKKDSKKIKSVSSKKTVSQKTKASASKPKKGDEDWEDPYEKEEVAKTEEDDFADEGDHKIENLDDTLLDAGDDAEEDEFYSEDTAF